MLLDVGHDAVEHLVDAPRPRRWGSVPGDARSGAGRGGAAPRPRWAATSRCASRRLAACDALPTLFRITPATRTSRVERAEAVHQRRRAPRHGRAVDHQHHGQVEQLGHLGGRAAVAVAAQPVEQAHDALDHRDDRRAAGPARAHPRRSAVAATPAATARPNTPTISVGRHQPGVQVAGGSARHHPVVRGVDVVGAHLERRHVVAAPAEGAHDAQRQAGLAHAAVGPGDDEPPGRRPTATGRPTAPERRGARATCRRRRTRPSRRRRRRPAPRPAPAAPGGCPRERAPRSAGSGRPGRGSRSGRAAARRAPRAGGAPPRGRAAWSVGRRRSWRRRAAPAPRRADAARPATNSSRAAATAPAVRRQHVGLGEGRVTGRVGDAVDVPRSQPAAQLGPIRRRHDQRAQTQPRHGQDLGQRVQHDDVGPVARAARSPPARRR